MCPRRENWCALVSVRRDDVDDADFLVKSTGSVATQALQATHLCTRSEAAPPHPQLIAIDRTTRCSPVTGSVVLKKRLCSPFRSRSKTRSRKWRRGKRRKPAAWKRKTPRRIKSLRRGENSDSSLLSLAVIHDRVSQHRHKIWTKSKCDFQLWFR